MTQHTDTPSADEMELKKIERYKWTFKDKKGAFAYISKNSLHIDHTHYQRENLSKQKIEEMRAAWSWISCGAISVAKRPDGSYWVMDGQYRWRAAMGRADISDLPCMVFVVHDIKEEAEGFININTLRKSMRFVNKYKALLAKGDSAALLIQRLADDVGRDTMSNNARGGVRCHQLLYDWAKRDPVVLSILWPLMDLLCKNTAVGMHIVDGLMHLERTLADGVSLADRKHWNRLVQIGHDELVDAARAAVRFHGKGGGRIWADGILRRYNKGLVNKLALREGAAI